MTRTIFEFVCAVAIFGGGYLAGEHLTWNRAVALFERTRESLQAHVESAVRKVHDDIQRERERVRGAINDLEGK